MSIAQRTIDGAPEWYDTDTFETLDRVSSLKFADDFHRHKDANISRDRMDAKETLEPGQEESNDKLFDWYPSGMPWDTVETMGDAVELVQTREAYAKLGVNAGDVTQLSVLYWGDSLILDPGNDLVFEARAQLSVLPTGEGGELAEAYIGLASKHNSTVSSIQTSAWFKCSGSGEVVLESDDNTTVSGPTQVGVSLTAGVWRIFRIAIHGTSATYSVDGVEVGTQTLAALEDLQPYFRVSKTRTTANTDSATMLVDYVKVWASR
jgi:hypothetical protein